MATWGSLKKDAAIPENRYGLGQGYFRYYKENNGYETIVAVGGRLVRDGGDLSIEGLPNGFQKDRMIEAVQWQDKMFFATGTKLVEYDGMTAKVMEAYKPLPLEALYAGTNGLAEFPDNYMQDGTETFLRVDGVVPSLRLGIANTPTEFTAFISKPGAEIIQYKWEYKLANRETLLLGQEWSETAKTWSFIPKDIGDYVVQVSARVKGTTANPPIDSPEVFQIPVYKVSAFDENKKVDTSQMHTCNQIMLHWERLIVYGDQKNTSRIYISHLENPRYFPVNNSIDFENNEQEPLQKLVQFRDFIVAFMPSTIQALYGNGPTGNNSYRRVVIHTGLGCVAPETPKVIGNYIAFLSKEGIHYLKSIGTVEEKMNVEKIDSKIANLIIPQQDAAAVVFDNQYHICFPRQGRRFRFYAELGSWTKDESPLFDFCRLYEWNGDLVGQSQSTGKTYSFNGSVYDDAGHVYDAKAAFKKYDFREPHNPKKLKQQQLILTNDSSDKNVKVEVYGDDTLVIGEDAAEMISKVNENTNIVKVPLSPQSKVRTAQTVVRHAKAEKFHLLAVGYIFKTKKP